LRTGDLGFIENNHLFISGRIKELIIVRGEKHYLHDFEDTAMTSSPLIRPGCVAAFPAQRPTLQDSKHANSESVIIVAEVRKSLSASAYKELGGAIATKIKTEIGVVVAEIILIPSHSICKTTSGKIQREGTRDAINQGDIKVQFRYSPVADLTP
jgi:acyl-CoA synthetase (AMP-forming)/AMP-acid ligase II